jgi:hypothetical protein
VRTLSRIPRSNVLSNETTNAQEARFRNGRKPALALDGHVIGIVGEPGRGEGTFVKPTDMAFLPDGRLLVSDESANRIVILSTPLAPPGASPVASPPA